MWDFSTNSRNLEQVNRTTSNQLRTEMFLRSFMDNYYKDVEKPVIIEREKVWGTPDNLALIKNFITPTPKIIFTVRDILEILASFIRMDAEYLKRDANNANLYITNYRSEQDLLCEFLMATNGVIDKPLLSLASAFYPENKGIFHIVEYSDLVLKPEETMANIYDFLEMPHYEHNFHKIEKTEQDNDEGLGLPKDLHDVRASLSQSSTSLDILSDYIRHKYSNMEFWRAESVMKIRGKDF